MIDSNFCIDKVDDDVGDDRLFSLNSSECQENNLLKNSLYDVYDTEYKRGKTYIHDSSYLRISSHLHKNIFVSFNTFKIIRYTKKALLLHLNMFPECVWTPKSLVKFRGNRILIKKWFLDSVFDNIMCY